MIYSLWIEIIAKQLLLALNSSTNPVYSNLGLSILICVELELIKMSMLCMYLAQHMISRKDWKVPIHSENLKIKKKSCSGKQSNFSSITPHFQS